MTLEIVRSLPAGSPEPVVVDTAALASLIQKLARASFDDRFSTAQQTQFMFQAKTLRGQLTDLALKHFTGTTARIEAINTGLVNANDAVAAASAKLEAVAETINGITKLIASITSVLKIVAKSG